MSDLAATWLARADKLETEAVALRAMARTDEDAGRYDLATRNRRAAGDRAVQADTYRECVRELAPQPVVVMDLITGGERP